MNTAEQRYAAHERELFSIVDTLRTWRAYVHGHKFVVRSDHFPLKYLETEVNLSRQQVRWLETLVDFDFCIIPIKGKSNIVADPLSRIPNTLESTDKSNQELLQEVIPRTLNNISLSEKLTTADLNLLILEYLKNQYF